MLMFLETDPMNTLHLNEFNPKYMFSVTHSGEFSYISSLHKSEAEEMPKFTCTTSASSIHVNSAKLKSAVFFGL